MDRQRQIEEFSLAAHRLVLSRMRTRPASIDDALATLNRWRDHAGGVAHCEPYWREWEKLLRDGFDAVQLAVCARTDHAAVLRSVSPLGRFMTPGERKQLLSEARVFS